LLEVDGGVVDGAAVVSDDGGTEEPTEDVDVSEVEDEGREEEGAEEDWAVPALVEVVVAAAAVDGGDGEDWLAVDWPDDELMVKN
jgi:hypothetical protein